MVAVLNSAEDDHHVTLVIRGQLGFMGWKQCREALNALPSQTEHVTVDLTDFDSIDSSGLGLLLQIRSRRSNALISIRAQAGSLVEQRLKTVWFDKLFDYQSV